MQKLKRRLKVAVVDRKIPQCILTGKFNLGNCPICEHKTLFLRKTEWLRDNYICMFCASIPRQRALITILEQMFPNWRKMNIHESSPGGASSAKLKRECNQYVPTHYYSEVLSGNYKNSIRCENLEKMTFEDASFDLVITQDVFEHILNPDKAFSEIARILKPGGAHIFTIPYYSGQETVVRAIKKDDGIEYLQQPVYHGNPIDKRGALVVTDWGDSLVDFIYLKSGMATTIYNLSNLDLGIDGKFLEVFVSSKKK